MQQQTSRRATPRSPFVFDLRELGRRPGALREYQRRVPAPAGLGLDVIGVPEGAPLTLELRLESVTEGVLVTGAVTATAPRTRRLSRMRSTGSTEICSTSNRWCVTQWCSLCRGHRCAGRTAPASARPAGSGWTNCLLGTPIM